MFQSKTNVTANIRSCPKCKSSDYNNRYFKLKINECGHSLCENCVESLFVRQSGPCPVCGRNLKKSAYWDQIFDDPLIEKQTYFRKRLQKVFNLKRENFETLRQFNDYLETFETYVFNLTYDLDVEETKRKIERFQNEHEELIAKNKNRLSQDEEWVQRLLDEENQAKQQQGKEINNGISSAEKLADDLSAANDPKSIIAELMTSNTDASQIVGRKRYEAMKMKEELELKRAALGLKRSADSVAERNNDINILRRKKLRQVGRKIDNNDVTSRGEQIVPLSSTSHSDLGKPFVYQKQDLHINGPEIPDLENLAPKGYLTNIKSAVNWQLAGGYFAGLGCRRALTEAFCDLFL